MFTEHPPAQPASLQRLDTAVPSKCIDFNIMLWYMSNTYRAHQWLVMAPQHCCSHHMYFICSRHASHSHNESNSCICMAVQCGNGRHTGVLQAVSHCTSTVLVKMMHLYTCTLYTDANRKGSKSDHANNPHTAQDAIKRHTYAFVPLVCHCIVNDADSCMPGKARRPT